MAEEFIIAGWMDYGENRDAVLEHFAVCAEHSRAESGCLDYVVTADPVAAGRIVVFERWESEPDLAAHFQMPHITEFRNAIAPYERLDRSIRRYFISRDEEFESSKVTAS
jgi:quinol monooxygenase YgiN